MHNRPVPHGCKESKKYTCTRLQFGHTLTSESRDALHIRHETCRQYRQQTLVSDDQPSGERCGCLHLLSPMEPALQPTIKNFEFEHKVATAVWCSVVCPFFCEKGRYGIWNRPTAHGAVWPASRTLQYSDTPTPCPPFPAPFLPAGLIQTHVWTFFLL